MLGSVALAVTAVVVIVASGSPAAAPADPTRTADAGAAVRLGLPAPTGAYRVGTTSLRLVDSSRTDPLAPTVRSREWPSGNPEPGRCRR